MVIISEVSLSVRPGSVMGLLIYIYLDGVRLLSVQHPQSPFPEETVHLNQAELDCS